MKSSSKLFISDQRMLELMEYSMIHLNETQKEWCLSIGLNPSNVAQIRTGRQGFTDVQKLVAVKRVNANMNWIFGLEANMIRITKETKALDLIKQGVRMLEKK